MATTLALQLYKKRKVRQNASAFKVLLATPASGTAVLPASGMFALRPDAVTTQRAGVTVTGPSSRTISVPALAAGVFHHIGKLERGSSVTVEAGIDLYVDTGLGKYRKIVNG